MTIRTPRPGLFVSGLKDSFRIGPEMDLVIDCCGRGGDRPNGIIARPSAGDHQWSVQDLDRIVGVAVPHLRAGHRVLVHCRSGRSRSTTAAAAVILAMDEADDLEGAVLRSSRPSMDGPCAPDRRCMTSLRAWHIGRQSSLFW